MRIVFFGTPLFAVPAIRALLQSGENVSAVVTQPDKRKGRDRLPSPPPVKEAATGEGIEVLQPESIRNPDFISLLRAMRPEIIVVVAYGRILPVQILELPAHGCVNIHASLLPKYRGAAPIQWAIIKGEKKTGITTMLMDKGLDTGDILLQEETDIYDDDDAGTLGRRLAEIGASLLIKTVKGIKDGSARPVPQKGPPSFAPMLKKEDGKIDWSDAAIDIVNLVRGLYPWPCAYCHLNKERIRITRTKALSGGGLAGRIEKAGDDLVVGTGEGLLSILELQPEGKRPMTAREFLAGRRLREGIFLS
jgi:methionyl-tRNA formyltransferase